MCCSLENKNSHQFLNIYGKGIWARSGEDIYSIFTDTEATSSFFLSQTMRPALWGHLSF